MPDYDEGRLEEFLGWMCKRRRIYQRRFVEEQPPPWIDDPVLRDYHFCHVHRRLDRATQYVLENILTMDRQVDIVFNVALFRFINRPAAYEAMGGPTTIVEFDVDAAAERLLQYGRDNPIFSSAYRVTPHDWAGKDTKIENILYGIFSGGNWTVSEDDILWDFSKISSALTQSESLENAFDALGLDVRGVIRPVAPRA